MEGISVAAPPEEFIDVAALRIVDLRTLGQDEIRCLAHLCGDVPARLQGLVNVIVDKSIFNESAGSRRQTYDRDRLPRNKERRLSTGSASAQLHLAMESAGLPHKDLILHLCRQLNIENGDKALYQPQALHSLGVVAEGNRPMSLKRMARASACFAGRADAVIAPVSKAANSEVLINGKELAMTALHRSGKKLKTKDEARRRAAESQAGAVVASESQEDMHAFVAVKSTSFGHDERVLRKDMPPGGANSPSQFQNDLQSCEAGIVGALGPSLETPKPSNPSRSSFIGKPHKRMKLTCSTCEGSFANFYSLRRHTVSTGHALDAHSLRTRIGIKGRKTPTLNSGLRCSCGNTYATPYTLRRHAGATGHFVMSQTKSQTKLQAKLQKSMSQETTSSGEHPEPVAKKSQETDSNANIKLEKRKLGVLVPEHAWKGTVRHYTCRHCRRQFIRKKLYVRHMGSHFRKAKKKMRKSGHRLLGGQLGASSNEVKARLGRPPKVEQTVHIKQGTIKQKRKHETESLDRRVKSHKAEESPQPTWGSDKLVLICQECGRIFNEFSRYTGHLSMHVRMRKVLINEASTPGTALLKKMLNIEELSALGFRKLLSDTTGTYLSGLPAKLLFSGADLANKRKGKA